MKAQAFTLQNPGRKKHYNRQSERGRMGYIYGNITVHCMLTIYHQPYRNLKGRDAFLASNEIIVLISGLVLLGPKISVPSMIIKYDNYYNDT